MILIVGKDRAILDKAKEVLNRTRQVFLASDSTHAIELARTLNFSVTLVDLDIGAARGVQFIHKLHEQFPDLPIIAIAATSVSRKYLLESLGQSGVVEVLQKPITADWKPVVEKVRAMRGPVQ